MSQPPPYTRSTNFTDYEVSNPNDPLEGSSVDTELNDVKTTLDAVLVNMALLQRDDGEQANNTIGYDQLKSDVTVAVTARGEWATATEYAVGDVTWESGILYVCNTAHTSGTFATDLSATKWSELLDVASQTSTATAAASAAGSAQTAAEAAQTGAEAAETGALAAQTAAETAETNAETAQTAAEAAQTAAEAAQATVPTVISAPTTYTIGAAGDYATVTAAMAALNAMIIKAAVTLDVQAEVITEPAAVVFEHSGSHHISITGAAKTSTTISSIAGAIVSNGAGDHEVEYNVADSTGFTTGKFVLVSAVTGTGRKKNHQGVYEIVSAGSNKVKVKNTNQNATFPAGTAVTGGDIEQFNSEIDASAGSFDFRSGGKWGLGDILIKDAVGVGLKVRYNAEVYVEADIGVANSVSVGIQCEQGGRIDGVAFIAVSGAGGDGASVFAGGGLRTSQSLILCGNGSDGLQFTSGGQVYSAGGLAACGNGSSGLRGLYSASAWAPSLVADDNGNDGIDVSHGAAAFCHSGTASGNASRGYNASTGGYLRADGCTADSNGDDGFSCQSKGTIYAAGSTASNNTSHGFTCDDASVITASTSTSSSNGGTDYYALNTSYIDAVSASGGASYSPAVNTAGNEEAYINS